MNGFWSSVAKLDARTPPDCCDCRYKFFLLIDIFEKADKFDPASDSLGLVDKRWTTEQNIWLTLGKSTR